MAKNKYAFARMFVTQHREYIEKELECNNTVKVIWEDLMLTTSVKIPYNTFIYNVTSLITNKKSIAYHKNNTEKVIENKTEFSTPKATPAVKTVSKKTVSSFEFSAAAKKDELI